MDRYIFNPELHWTEMKKLNFFFLLLSSEVMIFKQGASKMEYSSVDLSEILPLNNQSSSPKLLIRRQVAPYCLLCTEFSLYFLQGLWYLVFKLVSL